MFQYFKKLGERPAPAMQTHTTTTETSSNILFNAGQAQFTRLQNILERTPDPLAETVDFEKIQIISNQTMYLFEKAGELDYTLQVALYMIRYYLKHPELFGPENTIKMCENMYKAITERPTIDANTPLPIISIDTQTKIAHIKVEIDALKCAQIGNLGGPRRL